MVVAFPRASSWRPFPCSTPAVSTTPRLSRRASGLNGVGVKAVNALSARFEVKSFRDGKVRALTFAKGVKQSDHTESTDDEQGTYI